MAYHVGKLPVRLALVREPSAKFWLILILNALRRKGGTFENVNRTLTLAAVLLFLNPIAVCQTPSHASDCSTLKYLRHEVSCLCGTVQVCSGDICLRPS